MTEKTRERIIAKLILELPLSAEERAAIFGEQGLSREESGIKTDMHKRLKAMCDGREFCVGCPHLARIGKTKYSSCEEYVAIQMILEAKKI